MKSNRFYIFAAILFILFINGNVSAVRSKQRRRNRPCSCGQPFGYKIVGGVQTRPGEFPWQVEFGFTLKRRFCGGTLVTDRHVVSAGHCFQKRMELLPKMKVYLGLADILNTNGYAVRKIKNAQVHPKYCRKYEHYDISVVTLNRPVKFTMFISPVCFPPANQNYSNTMLTVIGFGRLAENGQTSSLLRKVFIPVRTNDTCISHLEGYPLKSHQLCGFWFRGKKDACQGDSGSSMTYKDVKKRRWYFVGIVSYGWGCGEPAMPALYTRVDYFYSWIFPKIKNGKVCDE